MASEMMYSSIYIHIYLYTYQFVCAYISTTFPIWWSVLYYEIPVSYIFHEFLHSIIRHASFTQASLPSQSNKKSER